MSVDLLCVCKCVCVYVCTYPLHDPTTHTVPSNHPRQPPTPAQHTQKTTAQWIFVGLYLATLAVVLLIYRKARLAPLWALPCLILSKARGTDVQCVCVWGG